MSKVFSFELHKLFRSKSFYIWTVISIALSTLFLVVSFFVYKTVNSEAFILAAQESDPSTNSLIMQPESGIISMVKFFAKSPIAFCIMVFVCSFVCDDFENGILKNVISKGYSRTVIFTAKYITLLIASCIMTALNAIIVFAVSTALYGNMGESYGTLIPQMLLLLFGIMTFTGLFFMLCTIIKKNAPAVIISILSLLLLPQALSLVNMGLKLKNFDFSVLWFGSQLDSISNANVTAGMLAGAAVCFVIYFIITYIVSIVSVRKMEV